MSTQGILNPPAAVAQPVDSTGVDGLDVGVESAGVTLTSPKVAPLPWNVQPSDLLDVLAQHGAAARYDAASGKVLVRGYRTLPEHLQTLLSEHRDALAAYLEPRDIEVELHAEEPPLPVEPPSVEPESGRPRLVPRQPPKRREINPQLNAIARRVGMALVRRVVPTACTTHEYLASQGAPWGAPFDRIKEE